MSVLYIKEQGSCIQKRSERLIVAKGSRSLLEIPAANVENVAVFGNVQITAQALHMLLEQGINVNFFTFSGKYLGQAGADTSKNIFLRFAQYEMYHLLPRRLEIAKAIVRNKVKNQIYVIKHHRWAESGEDYNWKQDVEQMEGLLEKLPQKETSNEILGVEGMCSNIYFGTYGKMFHCDFKFSGRNRRPPKDPINVLVSLGYTFLTREVSSALDAESFEMYLGFLHGIRYGRKSLPLDIVEEFRQPVIDRFVINLCNKRMINKFDFDTEGDRVLLNEDGFKKFCFEFEHWMTGRGGINYRAQVKKQAAKLKTAIIRKEPYVPFSMEDESVFGEL